MGVWLHMNAYHCRQLTHSCRMNITKALLSNHKYPWGLGNKKKIQILKEIGDATIRSLQKTHLWWLMAGRNNPRAPWCRSVVTGPNIPIYKTEFFRSWYTVQLPVLGCHSTLKSVIRQRLCKDTFILFR